MSEFVGMRVNPNPEYWDTLAKDDFAAATVLAEAGCWNASVLHSHAAVEKSLKRLLAIQGNLSEEDKTHSVALLAHKAGILEGLDPAGLATINLFDNLHERTSYPADLVKFRMVNEEGFAKMVWESTCRLIKYINTVAEGINGKEDTSE